MKTAMKAFGVRLPDETKLYYEQEAAAMGVTIGDRIRRILKQHMDAEKRPTLAANYVIKEGNYEAKTQHHRHGMADHPRHHRRRRGLLGNQRVPSQPGGNRNIGRGHCAAARGWGVRVENPVFEESGEVENCSNCPFELMSIGICSVWLQAHGKACPTSATYAEAVTFAEAAERGGGGDELHLRRV